MEIHIRKRCRFASIVIAAVQVASVAVGQQVLTESGAISGVREGELSVYKGVPFATPPVGDLRWQPPARVAPWTGTRKADVFAPECLQMSVSIPGETPPAVSEDCLYLNIWMPAKSVATASAGDRLDIRWGLHQWVGFDALVLGRPARVQRRDRGHDRVSPRAAWLSCTSGADTRVPASLVRELRPDGSDSRTRMGSEQHCSLWR